MGKRLSGDCGLATEFLIQIYYTNLGRLSIASRLRRHFTSVPPLRHRHFEILDVNRCRLGVKNLRAVLQQG